MGIEALPEGSESRRLVDIVGNHVLTESLRTENKKLLLRIAAVKGGLQLGDEDVGLPALAQGAKLFVRVEVGLYYQGLEFGLGARVETIPNQ